MPDVPPPVEVPPDGLPADGPGSAVKPFAVHERSPTHVIIEIFGGDNDLGMHVREDLFEAGDGLDGPFAVLALADFLEEEARVVEVSRAGLSTLESWGEIDTGDPAVLTRFLARALATYGPDVPVAIGFWDHGTGVFDERDPADGAEWPSPGAAQPAPGRPRSRLFLGGEHPDNERAMLHDVSNRGLLTNREAGRVLADAFAQAGRQEKVALIFSDTCLNGMLEVVCEMEAYANVIVGSEDVEPSFGWDYTEWLRRMSEAPPADPETWARMAVLAFADAYRDRTELHPCTLAAFRTEGGLVAAFADLVVAARAAGMRGVRMLRDARDYAQAFAGHDSYDIGHFARLLVEDGADEALATAAGRLREALLEARIEAVALGDSVRDAEGLAFWFPRDQFGFRRVEGTYRELAFDLRTGWTAYLRERYGG